MAPLGRSSEMCIEDELLSTLFESPIIADLSAIVTGHEILLAAVADEPRAGHARWVLEFGTQP